MLDFSSLSQIITLLATSTMLQQASTQAVVEPITTALNQFATTIAQAAPNIIAALILLGIGLLVGRVIGWVVRKVAETGATADEAVLGPTTGQQHDARSDRVPVALRPDEANVQVIARQRLGPEDRVR